MIDWELRAPVAMLIFNRPETTARVFERVREARPPKLLVVADGPRPERPDEAERTAAARAVIEGVDWECELLTEYSEANLGCRRRVSSGLDWVFETVEEAIVLEDDCVPEPSFFRFCDELLERYREEERLMHISGDNFQSGRRVGQGSYYFTRYPHVWGWASWRRAWRHHDVELREWTALDETGKDSLLLEFEDPAERSFWRWAWDGAATGAIDTWDLQWVFTGISRGRLSVNPNVNLVSNIGFGDESTHTGDDEGGVGALPTEEIAFPLRDPERIERDPEADERTASLFFRRDG
jgi:hypothetical protein